VRELVISIAAPCLGLPHPKAFVLPAHAGRLTVQCAVAIGRRVDFELTRNSGRSNIPLAPVAREEMLPFARQWDEDEIFPVDTLREAAALGFGGIYVAADVGGSALSRFDAVLIFEELAQGCPRPRPICRSTTW